MAERKALSGGDPFVEWSAGFTEALLKRHGNWAVFAAWGMRITLYGLLVGMVVTTISQLATLSQGITWSSLWCLPRALLTALAALAAVSLLVGLHKKVRKLIEQRLPWSLLVIAAFWGVDVAVSGQAAACPQSSFPSRAAPVAVRHGARQ